MKKYTEKQIANAVRKIVGTGPSIMILINDPNAKQVQISKTSACSSSSCASRCSAVAKAARPAVARAGKWSIAETILALYAYVNGKTKQNDVKVLSKALGRSSGAVTWKFSNLRRFDPKRERGVIGAKCGSATDKEAWNYYFQSPTKFNRKANEALRRLSN
jgi:hypothetical protein